MLFLFGIHSKALFLFLLCYFKLEKYAKHKKQTQFSLNSWERQTFDPTSQKNVWNAQKLCAQTMQNFLIPLALEDMKNSRSRWYIFLYFIWAPWLRTKDCLPKVEKVSTCLRTKDIWGYLPKN